jgi:hypothetical protein
MALHYHDNIGISIRNCYDNGRAPGSSHPYKYRLHYQKTDASVCIRYDNEQGKGDHRHIDGIEEPYCFESVKKLAQDIYAAIKQVRTTGGIE